MFKLKTNNYKPKTNTSMNPYLSDEEINYIIKEVSIAINNQ